MISIFEQFLKERTYLKNSSPKALVFYRSSFRAYQKFAPPATDIPTQQDLNNFVSAMREKGVKAVTCNTYIRGMNSFLTWLYENEYTAQHLKIKQLKCEQKVVKTFTDGELRRIIAFKPESVAETRIHMLTLLALDTGARINELLTLTRNKVDFENLVITGRDKGNKERIIPISLELRKRMYKFLNKHQFDLVFCTRNGRKLLYDNCRRDYKRLLDRIGIEKCDQSFHSLRKCFARAYVRNGGNLFYCEKN